MYDILVTQIRKLSYCLIKEFQPMLTSKNADPWDTHSSSECGLLPLRAEDIAERVKQILRHRLCWLFFSATKSTSKGNSQSSS